MKLSLSILLKMVMGEWEDFGKALFLESTIVFFKYVPIESLIEKNQKQYYLVLEKSDQTGESTVFVEFMLEIIYRTLQEMSCDLVGITDSYEVRIEHAHRHFKNRSFTRKNYMALLKSISSATASRDLRQGVLEKKLKKQGERAKTQYKFRGPMVS